MNVEELVEHVRVAALERIGPKLRPDGDWVPIVFWWNGSLGMIQLSFPDDDRSMKVAAYMNAASQVEHAQAWLAATVATGWMVQGRDMAEGERPSQAPDRIEVLIIHGVDWAGGEARWTGQVERHEDGPPTVTVLDDAADAVGLMIDPLRAALARVALRHGPRSV